MDTGMDMGSSLLNGYNITALLHTISGLSDTDKSALFKEIGIENEEDLLCFIQSAECGVNNPILNKGYEEEMMQFQEFRLHRNLLLFIPPIMLIMGTIGNVLSFIILTRKSMRRLSTYTYLAVLSMTDILVLYVGLLRLWVGALTGKDVRDHAVWICKTINVLGYTVSDYSVWLIIAMTVERWIAVCMPLKAPSMCNRRRAVSVIMGIFSLLFIINLHFFWTTEIRHYSFSGVIQHQCDSGELFEKLNKLVWPWVDAFIYSFFPFVVILTLNGLIIHSVILSKKQRGRLTAGSAASWVKSKGSSAKPRAQRQGESSTKLTVMLLTISFTFLLTTLPMNVLLIVKAFITQSVVPLSRSLGAKITLARTITELLMYVNHSMNFFLYCATGEKFRQQLLLLFCRSRAAQANPAVRWHSDFTQGFTEKTALTHGGTLNVHRMQVRSKHGPCKTKNCPLVSSPVAYTRSNTEASAPLNRLTGDGIETISDSAVTCRMEVKVSCGNGGSMHTINKVDYSRIQHGEV